MKKWLLGGFGVLALGIVFAALFYPEDFAMMLVGLFVGLFLGITLATVLMESYFHKGAAMAHELQKKQVVDPAKIMRETRLASKEASGSGPANQQKSIPQFNITGLDNHY